MSFNDNGAIPTKPVKSEIPDTISICRGFTMRMRTVSIIADTLELYTFGQKSWAILPSHQTFGSNKGIGKTFGQKRCLAVDGPKMA